MQGKLASFLNFINLLDTKVGKDLRTLTFDFSDCVVVHDYSNFMMETQWPTIKNIFYGLVCFRKLSEFIWKNPSAWIWGSGQYAPPATPQPLALGWSWCVVLGPNWRPLKKMFTGLLLRNHSQIFLLIVGKSAQIY